MAATSFKGFSADNSDSLPGDGPIGPGDWDPSIAMVVFLYMLLTAARRQPLDMPCLDKVTSYLFYAVIVDFSLEALDFI